MTIFSQSSCIMVGFFVGSGQLRTYVDEKISWFDYCEGNFLYPQWWEDLLEVVGYSNMSDSLRSTLKVYWLLPGKDLSDGLRLIKDRADNDAMRSVVGRVKTLVVYIDHGDTLCGGIWDDAVVNPSADLPKVFSPTKIVHVEKKEGEELRDFYKNLRSNFDEEQNSEQGKMTVAVMMTVTIQTLWKVTMRLSMEMMICLWIILIRMWLMRE